MMEHRGYLGSVEYTEEDETLHGRLAYIRDLVTYEGEDAKGLKRAFEVAVDDYLELCETSGRKPDQPLKGSFNIRPGRDLHRRAALYAQRRGVNLNSVVTDALRRYLDREDAGTTAPPARGEGR